MRIRSLFLAALTTLTLAGMACTSDDPSVTPSPVTPTPTDEPIPTPDYGEVAFVEGEFAIKTSGIIATLSVDQSTGELRVRNGSTIDLGEAGVVVITQTQDEVAATVDGPSAIAIGETGDYTVELGEGLTFEEVGLIRLEFDGVSIAVFGPVVDEG